MEIDKALAESLSRRLNGQNVTVLNGDATAMSFPDASFDGAVSFTMLHHVPSARLQDRLLAEVARVLRPGATFAGTDSLYSRILGLLHLFDTMVVVDPKTFPGRLQGQDSQMSTLMWGREPSAFAPQKPNQRELCT